MKHFALLVCLLFTTGLLRAQTVEALQSLAKKELHIDEVEHKYDKFKDRTTLTLHLLVSGDPLPFEGLMLSTGFSYEGKIKPPSLTESKLLVTYIDGKTEIRKGPAKTLIFLADNNRLKLPVLLYEPDKYTKSSVNLVAYTFSLDNLKSMAVAKVVEGQFGDLEFVLTQKQLDSIKQLYSKLTSL